MIGLKWYLATVPPCELISRRCVARKIADIAGGEAGDYSGRAGQMIKNALYAGYLEKATGCERYYRAVNKSPIEIQTATE